MSLLSGTLAGSEAAPTPVEHLRVADLMSALLFAGAGIEAAANTLGFHVFPRYASDMTLVLVGRFDGGATGVGDSGGLRVSSGERRQAGLFTSSLKELLDVRPIVPVDDIVFVRLEELFNDG